MPLTDPVPSSSFDVLERNVQDTDKFVNQETGTFTNRVGKVIKPIPVIEAAANAAIISLGWTPVGEFATGFTYLLQNDIAKDAAGDWYRWNGTLPKVVTAGTLPSSDANFVKIDYKSHAELSDRNPADGSAHNADDIAKDGGGSVQDFIDDLELPTSTTLIGGQTAESVGIAAQGIFGPVKLSQGSATNLLVRSVLTGPTRVHVEPNGYIDDGTASKTDWMLDPYQDDTVNYRIGNIFTMAGDDLSLGENGRVVINAKGTGTNFGVYPAIHMGFQDGSSNGVCMKLYYFDTSDTVWRTPMKGAWREARSFTTGDYALASNKLYQATTTGTSGATIPSHSSGNASDGGVSWDFIRDYAAVASNIKPAVVFGDRGDMPIFGHSGVRAQFLQRTLMANGKGHDFADSSGLFAARLSTTTSSEPFFNVTLKGGTVAMRWACDSKYYQSIGVRKTLTPAVRNSTSTPSAATTELISFGNTVSTDVTSFTDMLPNQVFTVISNNANTTLKHNANIKLKGSVDLIMQQYQPVQFLVDSTGLIAMQL